jgi:energy-converting hydrogenase Eha subunit B
MDQKPIEQTWWFRGTVGVLTLLSGIALFAVAGLGIHTFVSALIAFLCLLGLERLFSGLLAMILVLLRARRTTRNRA